MFGSCSNEPIYADGGFSAQGYNYAGPYAPASYSGFTTSGNVVTGQLCLTDVLSED